MPPSDETQPSKMEGFPDHPVAEFLFQLTKMLSDDNTHYIEWIHGECTLLFPSFLEKSSTTTTPHTTNAYTNAIIDSLWSVRKGQRIDDNDVFPILHAP